MANEKAQDRKVNMPLGDITGVEGIDYDDFNFIDTKIETLEIMNYGTPEEERLTLKITTSPLNETEIRAVEFISLFRDKEGNVHYSKSAGSNAGKMLEYFKVSELNELVGKAVKSLIKVNDKGVKRIGFAYGN